MNVIKFNCHDVAEAYDWTEKVNKACLNAGDNTVLAFEEGTYYFYPTYAYEQHCYITNNDHSQKRIAFPVFNKKGFTIQGKGARFIFVGRILPFFVVGCENITLEGFTMDYKRPLYSQGLVLEASPTVVKLKIDSVKFPYKVVKDHFVFIGDYYEGTYVHGMLAFDPDEKKPARACRDNHVGGELKGIELEKGIIEIHHDFRKHPEPGQFLTIKHERRFVPGIALDHSAGLLLKDLNILAAGTMGVVAQYCSDIRLDHVVTAVEEGSDRMVSTNADSTHFVGCTGQLLVENCRFEQQLDDAFNVHGNYLDIEVIENDTTVMAKIGHFQQVGVFGLELGSRIMLLDRATLLDEQVLTLKSKEILNNQYVRLTFAERIVTKEGRSYSLEDMDMYPTIIFRNNTVRKNRARGILLTSRKPILIENNRFETEGAAIKISGDTNHWHESGAISELIIRNNYIASYNDVWGRAIIDIDPEMVEFEQGRYYHNRIIVEGNTIEIDNRPLFYGQSFKSLLLKNNTFIMKNEDSKYFNEIKAYGDFIDEGNSFK